MRLNIKRETLNRIFNHCVASYPYECCGLLLGIDEGERRVVDAVGVSNVHEDDRRVRYRIDPMKYYEVERQAEKKGLQVVGSYHSHPNVPAAPSQYDLDNSFPWYSYLIVSVGPQGVIEHNSWRIEESSNQRRFIKEEVSVFD